MTLRPLAFKAIRRRPVEIWHDLDEISLKLVGDAGADTTRLGDLVARLRKV